MFRKQSGFSVGRCRAIASKPVRYRSDVTPPTSRIIQDKQLIAYVKENYKDEYWVKEYSKLFDTDFGKFKFAVETLGLQLSDKMTNSEYKKTHRR